ncbi:MAG: glycosyl hydrolase family 18 [Candidatus Moranbacteria bacterium]|nr:glycosyl hydrolase family 18 [Candidatus Moranbacteria bacterium]
MIKKIVPSEPTRKLSLWRIFFALLVVSGLVYGTRLSVERWQHMTAVAPQYRPWFAAYVDVTATPTYPFEQLGSSENSNVVLSFVVSSLTDPCVPTWGTYYTLDQAAIALDLDRRIARLEQQGGHVALSFGGALNNELALQCRDIDALVVAYQSVIDRYHIDTIDLDLENEGLGDGESAERRAMAIARIQEQARNDGKPLAVWLTLPVAPQGLTKDGTDIVARFLAKGVDLAGVNGMTMDYGASRESGVSMLEASKQALVEMHRQLGILYTQAGIHLNSVSLWRKIGATPMIGQNDVVDEVFTTEDAQAFNLFARDQGVGRLSMWSANRDTLCGENYVDVKVVSDSCSGVKAPKASFAQALSTGFDGDLIQNARMLTTADPDSGTVSVDDPKKSPYQIWSETGTYPKGVKIVWHGNVYEAKWWTKNDLPDNPVLQSWETPWQLVGPVLSGEKPVQQPTLPQGTYPKWSGSIVYEGGDRVLFEGVPFQAKWWNQGASPAASAANSDSSPWLALTQVQIAQVLDELQARQKK